jgi:predicted ATP-grasp superfamily ATP-dependent carboligase
MTGLQTARILARHGVPVTGIARDPKHPCSRTNVCERVIFADTRSDELIEVLGKLGPDWKQRPVLFPCSDLSVLGLSRNREMLQYWYELLLPDPYVVEMLLDKFSFLDYAQREGHPIPKTFFLQRRADAERAAHELSYPSVLKPPMLTPQWKEFTTAKAFKVFNPEQLLSVYDRCSSWADMLLAQQWVAGTDAALYSCNCYFDARTEPLVTFVSRKLRQWPPEVGTSCLAEECRDDFVLEETVRLFRKVGLRGLGYLEMKKDPVSGQQFIIEPNIGRPTGRSAIAEAAGVELVYTAYCDAVGRPLPDNRIQRYKGAKWIYFRRDVQSAMQYWRRGELTLGGWWRSLQGPRTDALFSWTDPAPFCLDLYKGIARLSKNGTGSSQAAAALGRSDGSLETIAGMERSAKHDERCAAIDYDIHGIVGVRLIRPSSTDAAAVARQLGPLRCPLQNEPDITLRFVDSLDTPDLQYVELGKNGFARDGFYLLKSSKRRAKVRLDFEQIGSKCKIVCESGLRSVPQLLAIVNLTAMQKGCVPLHASAFEYKGTGILLAGWSKGGKTEALLAFAAKGARFIGDEWILLDKSGERMYGIPENIRLWDWHIESLDHVRAQMPYSRLFLFRSIRWLDRLQTRFHNSGLGRFLPLRLVREALPALKRQLNIQIEPEKLFGPGLGPFVGKPQKVFFMTSHPDKKISIEPIDAVEVAQRMAASIHHEELRLFADYLAYKFAFPDRRNELLEHAAELQRAVLLQALAGKEAYWVRHPYPVALNQLYEAMEPYCTNKGSCHDLERAGAPVAVVRGVLPTPS